MSTITLDNNKINTIYQAKYPEALVTPLYKKILKVFANFLSIILFPIGVIRLLDFGLRALVTRLAILPAARITFPKISENRVTFKTPDGVTLEGIYIEGKIPGKAIAVCMGNAMSCQNAFDQDIPNVFQKLEFEDSRRPTFEPGEADIEVDPVNHRVDADGFNARDAGAGENQFLEHVRYKREGHYQFLVDAGYSVLAFNPRDVGESGGIALPEDLPLDSYSALSYLREEKKMEKVGFCGFSLGAANGVRGAALFDPNIPVVLDRTFDNLVLETEILVAKLFSALKNSKNYSKFWWHRLVKILPPALAGKCAAFFIFILRLQINAREAYDKMAKGNVFCVSHQQDGVIPQEASMMRDEKLYGMKISDNHYQPEEDEDSIDVHLMRASFHIRRLEKKEQEFILDFLKDSLQ
jgi:hypothetical protein